MNSVFVTAPRSSGQWPYYGDAQNESQRSLSSTTSLRRLVQDYAGRYAFYPLWVVAHAGAPTEALAGSASPGGSIGRPVNCAATPRATAFWATWASALREPQATTVVGGWKCTATVTVPSPAMRHKCEARIMSPYQAKYGRIS